MMSHKSLGNCGIATDARSPVPVRVIRAVWLLVIDANRGALPGAGRAAIIAPRLRNGCFQKAPRRRSLNTGPYEGPGAALVFNLAGEAAFVGPARRCISEVAARSVGICFEAEEFRLSGSFIGNAGGKRHGEKRCQMCEPHVDPPDGLVSITRAATLHNGALLGAGEALLPKVRVFRFSAKA
jgi:hypothetical protein